MATEAIEREFMKDFAIELVNRTMDSVNVVDLERTIELFERAKESSVDLPLGSLEKLYAAGHYLAGELIESFDSKQIFDFGTDDLRTREKSLDQMVYEKNRLMEKRTEWKEKLLGLSRQEQISYNIQGDTRVKEGKKETLPLYFKTLTEVADFLGLIYNTFARWVKGNKFTLETTEIDGEPVYLTKPLEDIKKRIIHFPNKSKIYDEFVHTEDKVLKMYGINEENLHLIRQQGLLKNSYKYRSSTIEDGKKKIYRIYSENDLLEFEAKLEKDHELAYKFGLKKHPIEVVVGGQYSVDQSGVVSNLESEKVTTWRVVGQIQNGK